MSTRRDFLLQAGVAVAAPALGCRAEQPSEEPTTTLEHGDTREGAPPMSGQLSRVITAVSKSMGASFSVNSLELGNERSSPVMVVDDFRVSGRPFQPHPHAGFSAMTYVFRDSPGSLRNRDSLGGHVVVGPGGVCWLQAGSGAQHEEIPEEPGKELRGLQVFVNLSARNKLSAPRTFTLSAEQVPSWTSETGADVVRVVVGSYEGHTSPLVPLEPFTLLDVELRRELNFTLPREHNTVIYVRRGDAVLQTGGYEQSLTGGQAVIAFDGPGIVSAKTSSLADIVVLTGPELREPVVVNGPFIMNERAQIVAAIDRYRSGQMGHLEPFSES